MKGLKKFFLSFLFTQDPDLHYNKFEDPDKKRSGFAKLLTFKLLSVSEKKVFPCVQLEKVMHIKIFNASW